MARRGWSNAASTGQGSSSNSNLVKLDGRTGEGGGQVVRIAVCLAAITGTPLKIENVRGNRRGKNGGGGLKAQHVAGIRCLTEITKAEVSGCQVGCKTLLFEPRGSPADLVNRNILIKSETPGSVMMILQTLLPFLLFAGDDQGTPITLTIQGGTNVSFSASYEYVDQVLLPSLERFGVMVERKLERRGWTSGYRQIGTATFKIKPLVPGTCLQSPDWPTSQGKINKIDVSIVVPSFLHEALQSTLRFELDLVFPGVQIEFKVIEESGHGSRMYTLLVAHTTTGLRFGRDWLFDEKSKGMDKDDLSTRIAQKVVDDLDAEVRKGGLVDEYLQDQLVIFQALASGKSIVSACASSPTPADDVLKRIDTPFGDGSLHTTTARWVVSEILSDLKWTSNGQACEGVGWKVTGAEGGSLAAQLETTSLD